MRREYTFTLVINENIKTFDAINNVNGIYAIVKYDEPNSKVYVEMDNDITHDVIKDIAESWKELAEGEISKAV